MDNRMNKLQIPDEVLILLFSSPFMISFTLLNNPSSHPCFLPSQYPLFLTLFLHPSSLFISIHLVQILPCTFAHLKRATPPL